MRKIHYIFIVSDTETHDNQSGHYGKSDLRHQPSSLFAHHFIVNSEGLVIPGTDIHQPVHLGLGTRNLEPRAHERLERCSNFIRYCGSLRPETWILKPETSCKSVQQQRTALLNLLAALRQHFPSAKNLGLSELPETSNLKPETRGSIIVSDAMNVLRRELSDYP